MTQLRPDQYIVMAQEDRVRCFNVATGEVKHVDYWDLGDTEQVQFSNGTYLVLTPEMIETAFEQRADLVEDLIGQMINDELAKLKTTLMTRCMEMVDEGYGTRHIQSELIEFVDAATYDAEHIR